jgi:hypothetical protein
MGNYTILNTMVANNPEFILLLTTSTEQVSEFKYSENLMCLNGKRILEN